jgi:hypothetical protein
MNEERTDIHLLQVEHNSGHLCHIDFVTVDRNTTLQSHDEDRKTFQVMIST